MSNTARAVIFLISLLLLLFTLSKIHRMKQIRGEASGGQTYPAVVTDKWMSYSRSKGIEFAHYDLSWIADIPGQGKVEWQDRAEYADWALLQRGSRIQVVLVPGESKPYYSKSIFADDGNLAFDYGLLVIESAGMLFAVVSYLWHKADEANARTRTKIYRRRY